MELDANYKTLTTNHSNKLLVRTSQVAELMTTRKAMNHDALFQ